MLRKILSISLFSFFALLQTAYAYPNEIAPQQGFDLFTQGKAVIIDIREQNETAQGMAEPAVWYAKSVIDQNLEGFVQYLTQFSGKEIILYCRSGNRVSIVLEKLAAQNINGRNMLGYNGWVAAGLPTKLPQ